VPTGNDTRSSRPRARARVLLLCALALLIAPAAGHAAALTGAPPSLPGPPPAAGSGFPAPPAPGSVAVTAADRAAVTIPTRVSGPGLLNGTVRLHRLRLSLAIACRTGARLSLTAAAIRRGILARTSYRCQARRASPQLSLSHADARRLAALRSTTATLTIATANTTEQLSLTLTAGLTRPSYWTDGGLQCSLLGDYTADLAAPNFTITPSTTIDVRPWIAWYTAATGWQWLGTTGPNTSRWYRWTATPDGIQQFKTPAGAINPWTWAPISVHPAQHTYAIGVFEVRYWYPHPQYAWSYTRSSLNANTPATYCTYP
jgi:hypothetical protein